MSLDFLPSVEVRAWDRSIVILGARLQPLPQVGHTPWGPVALGTSSDLPLSQAEKELNSGDIGGGGTVHLCKIPIEKTFLSICEPSSRVLIS